MNALQIEASHSAQRRYERIRGAMEGAVESIGNVCPAATIVAYGSTGYGFNPNGFGKLDDVDLFVFIPKDAIHKLPIQLQEALDGPTMSWSWHFEGMLRGRWEIVRFYGFFDGVPIGMRIMTDACLSDRCRGGGLLRQVRAVSHSNVKSRLIGASLWSMRLSAYRYSRLSFRTEQGIGETAVVVTQGMLSPRGMYLGTLGRKLLSGRVVRDPAGRLASDMERLWHGYAAAYRRLCPGVSAATMVAGIYRSERFSEAHTQTLVEMAQAALCRVD